MSDRAYANVQAQQKTLMGSSSKGSLLQRTCACGQHTIAGGECSACRNERSTLLRSQRAFGSSSSLATAQNNSSTQENVSLLNSVVDSASHFGHDFSQIPVYSSHPPVLPTKLTINQPGDVYEQEADQLAEQVIRMPFQTFLRQGGASSAPHFRIQRVPPLTEAVHRQPEEKKEGEAFLAKEESDHTPTEVPELQAHIHSFRGGGQSLPESTRAFMETHLGHDFSQVRVHTDSKADHLARSVGALAFTTGQNIFFSRGSYNPSSLDGMRLLTHEVIHTVQQASGPREGQIYLQRAVRTKWRVGFDSPEEAEGQSKQVKDLQIKVDEPVKEGRYWFFYYYPLTKDEAEEEQKKQKEALGEKYDVTVEHNEPVRTFFVKVSLKCPEGIPPKPGFDIWAKCFPAESDAQHLRKQFEDAHIPAEVHKLDERKQFEDAHIPAVVYTLGKKPYGLYYKPMTSAEEARKAGEEVAKKRGGFAEGMFTVESSEKKALQSYTYTIKTACPKGFKDLGKFHLTAYTLAQEKDFPKESTVTDPCGLKGTFRKDFLFQREHSPYGVKMEGFGKSLSGQLIQHTTKDCFETTTKALTKTGAEAISGRTVAVDSSLIPLNSTLLIEDVGARVAEDTGGSIEDRHIDIYHGTEISAHEVNKFEMFDKKVCMKKE